MYHFKKRSFNAISLFTSSVNVFRFMPWIVWAYVLRGFSLPFCERILLVVSGVNACSYCSWLHSHVALRNGLSTAEVEQLLNQLIPQVAEEKDITALLFALHYAQSGGQPLAAEVEYLKDDYTLTEARGIQGLCAVIHFGNLCGNTFDAFISRLQGRPSSDSSLLIEIPVFVLFAPFLLPLLPHIKNA